MPSPPPWSLSALAGLGCSMRTFAGPAVLAARGRIPGRTRAALLLVAAGELALDKASFAPDRTDAPGLGARLATGAYTGLTIAGPIGAGAGAGAAAAGTYASYHARRLIGARTGCPDWVVAVVEDLLAYTAAALATRD